MIMIPPENKKYLLKKLKDGFDIRAACSDAKITRSVLYKYFKENPSFRAEVDKVIKTFAQRQEKSAKMSARHRLMHLKEAVRNQNN